jgi:hypothetical protein
MGFFSLFFHFWTFHRSMILFFIFINFCDKKHPHHQSCNNCSSCFRSFCIPIGLGGDSSSIKQMHYLIPFWFACWFFYVGFYTILNNIRVFNFFSFSFLHIIFFSWSFRWHVPCKNTFKVKNIWVFFRSFKNVLPKNHIIFFIETFHFGISTLIGVFSFRLNI